MLLKLRVTGREQVDLQLFIITCRGVCFKNSSIRMNQLYIQIVANEAMWYLAQVLMFCRAMAP